MRITSISGLAIGIVCGATTNSKSRLGKESSAVGAEKQYNNGGLPGWRRWKDAREGATNICISVGVTARPSYVACRLLRNERARNVASTSFLYGAVVHIDSTSSEFFQNVNEIHDCAFPYVSVSLPRKYTLIRICVSVPPHVVRCQVSRPELVNR